MKTNYFKIAVIALILAAGTSCMQKLEKDNDLQGVDAASSKAIESVTGGDHYYWSGGRKIWLDTEA